MTPCGSPALRRGEIGALVYAPVSPFYDEEPVQI